ncbi:Acyl-CoA synthetase (AMP-forming)/AMP-acid ligase II [Jatrophihabitans endophyticus]|uniref:Acyl-CoA synthetase (AMP-forming)/AMP-acid ligase II n=1 Tax=Jatrophihabitans endophyticus TaxID=1206085 RepID=A0A1M5U273_9ACTN|nr:AMP-binding protein [Jatrophihabitans endophyticus]SHH56946.1 Acyl-CoA synthetase (AMP-forming)/AMP-acid ligase II [Jatrophihabitans endophyticus]
MFYPLTVRDFLDRAEQVYPDRVAVIDEPEQPAASLGEITYREMAALARAQAARLDALGVPVGGRVAFVSENSARLLTSFYGVSGFGRVLVPVNFRLSTAEIGYIVGHSGADVVYADPAHRHVLDALDVTHKFVLGDDDDLYARDAEPRPWDDPDENATATINYTSGTTARPKGVQLTHRNNWLNATVFGLHTTISDRDVYLHTLPQFHANGWGMPFAMTGVGAQHVILRKVDGTEILRRVQRHGVTAMCAAPAVIAAALDAAPDWSGDIPGRDRVRIIAAGAPPPTRTIERVLDELGWEFIQIYGLTETSPLVTVNRQRAEWDALSTHERARRLGRAGAPALGVRVTVDADGEVLTQSNHNLAGYWEQPEATAEAQAGNWFHTGDGGIVDDDGYLVISDRKKDVIITGGENVSSIEVEDALMSYPAVKEVAVIGIPDDKWGELVTGLVVTDGSAVSAPDLIAHCRESLAGYKCPKRIDFVAELPRTATGKLQKFKLREEFWSERDRQVN